MATFEVNLSIEENGRVSQKRGYELVDDLDGKMTLLELLQWTKSALIITSVGALEEEQRLGFDNKPQIFVDKRPNKPLADVHPLGMVEFVARADIDDILIEAYEALLFRSKVLTGHYKSSHFVLFNGNQVATDLPSLKAWLASGPDIGDKDKIHIINIVPYARRLERYGVTAQRTQIKQDEKGRRQKKNTGIFFKVPNGTYYLTYRAISRKYKQNIGVRFTFVPGSLIGLADPKQAHHFKSGRKGRNSAGRTYLYPALVFTVKEGGVY